METNYEKNAVMLTNQTMTKFQLSQYSDTNDTIFECSIFLMKFVDF